MRFTCEKCNAKYNIADDKVRGKIIKVRCKRCNNLLVIRDQSSGAVRGAGFHALSTEKNLRHDESRDVVARKKKKSKQAQKPGEDLKDEALEPVWYCGLDGNEQGPLTLFDVEMGIRNGSITSEHFVWRDGLDDWIPIEQVPELKSFLTLPTSSMEAEKRREKARKRREQDKLKEKERKEKERKEKERKEKERKEKERKEKERKERERKERERKERERKGRERKERDYRKSDRIVAAISIEDEEPQEPEPQLPKPPVGDIDDDFIVEEVADELMQESLDDEYELLQSDPMAVVAKREKLGEISRVIAVQAGVGSHKRKLGLGILVIGTFILTIGLLVVLAFSQGWFTNNIKPGLYASGKKEKDKGNVSGEAHVSEQDAKRIRDSIWVVEPNKTNSSTGQKNQGVVSPAHSHGKTKQERELLAFYKSQDREKSEVMPRVPRGATSAAIEMLKLPSTKTQISPNNDAGDHGKTEVVPRAQANIGSHERLTDVQIHMVIRRHARQVKKCFERQLKRDPSIKGKLLVTARVKPNGRIKKVAINPEKFHGTYLEECLIKEIRHWRFPSFDGDAYDLTFPYALSARESY